MKDLPFSVGEEAWFEVTSLLAPLISKDMRRDANEAFRVFLSNLFAKAVPGVDSAKLTKTFTPVLDYEDLSNDQLIEYLDDKVTKEKIVAYHERALRSSEKTLQLATYLSESMTNEMLVRIGQYKAELKRQKAEIAGIRRWRISVSVLVLLVFILFDVLIYSYFTNLAAPLKELFWVLIGVQGTFLGWLTGSFKTLYHRIRKAK